MRTLVPTYIHGFDEELGGGVPKGHVAVVRGASGTMKSSLVYSILHRNARNGVKGLYVSVEQDVAGLVRQMASIGLDPAGADGVVFLDLSRGRERLEELAGDVSRMAGQRIPQPKTAIIKAELATRREQLGFDLLAIDSWRALELLLDFQDPRRETFEFFEWFRTLGCTTFLITELPETGSEEGLEEEFLADAVFFLKLERVPPTSYQRRIQCAKMRSANHSSDFYTLVLEGGRFEVAKAIS